MKLTFKTMFPAGTPTWPPASRSQSATSAPTWRRAANAASAGAAAIACPGSGGSPSPDPGELAEAPSGASCCQGCGAGITAGAPPCDSDPGKFCEGFMAYAEGAAAAAAGPKRRLPSAATSTADTASPPTGNPACLAADSQHNVSGAVPCTTGKVWAAQERTCA